MSRIGKQPIAIPPKVKVEVKGQRVSVEGPKGKLNWELPRRTSLRVDNGKVVVSRQGDDAQAKALHGLSRALVNNMVKGVSKFKALVSRPPSRAKVSASVWVTRIRWFIQSPIRSRSLSRKTPSSPSKDLTARAWARSPPKFAVFIRRSLTRARACVTPMSA